MSADGIWTEKIDVKSYETDFQQRWKPVCFFQRLQEAANDHNSRLGFDFQELAAQNILWILSRLKIYFYEFPRLGDEVTIRTWPKGRRRFFYLRDYEFLKPDGCRCAAATSAWLLMDGMTRRLLLPQNLPGRMPDNRGLYALFDRLEPIHPGLLAEQATVTPGYSAVDMAGHVNASRYIEWMMDCFPAGTFYNRRVDWLEVNYLSEIRWGETIRVSMGSGTEEDELWYFQGRNLTSGKIAFNAAWKLVDALA